MLSTPKHHVLQLILTAVFFSPFSEAAAIPDTTVDYGTLICTGKNFTGYCEHISAPERTCMNLGPALNDQANSASSDSFCYYFRGAGCDTTQYAIWLATPVPDLSVTPRNGPPGTTVNMSNQVSSVRCML